jgi:hypothetical protein
MLAACGTVHAGMASPDAAATAAASPAGTTAPAVTIWRTFPAGEDAETMPCRRG